MTGEHTLRPPGPVGHHRLPARDYTSVPLRRDAVVTSGARHMSPLSTVRRAVGQQRRQARQRQRLPERGLDGAGVSWSHVIQLPVTPAPLCAERLLSITPAAPASSPSAAPAASAPSNPSAAPAASVSRLEQPFLRLGLQPFRPPPLPPVGVPQPARLLPREPLSRRCGLSPAHPAHAVTPAARSPAQPSMILLPAPRPRPGRPPPRAASRPRPPAPPAPGARRLCGDVCAHLADGAVAQDPVAFAGFSVPDLDTTPKHRFRRTAHSASRP